MTNKNKIKIALDICMIFLFITFFDKNFVNMKFHMLSGIIFAVFILIHMFINRKWIISISKKLFDKKIKLRIKISYIVSFLLLISVGLIIVSGFYIILAPVNRKMFWKMIHYTFSYISIALIGIHLGLYWKWVMNMFKKLFKLNSQSKVRSQIAKFITLIILVGGLFMIHNKNYFTMMYSGINYISQNMIVEKENKETSSQEDHNNQNYAVVAKKSLFELVSVYGSIVSVFAIITYQADSLKGKNRVKTNTNKEIA